MNQLALNLREGEVPDVKQPSFPMYWGDWLRDYSVRCLSWAARGMWIDLICLMAQGDPYGHLRQKGVVATEEDIRRMLGSTPEEFNALFGEIKRLCISRDEEGCYYSKRMVEDADRWERENTVRAKKSAGGRVGYARSRGLPPGSSPGISQSTIPGLTLGSSPYAEEEEEARAREEGKGEGEERPLVEADLLKYPGCLSVGLATPDYLAVLWNHYAAEHKLPRVRVPMEQSTAAGQDRWEKANARLREHPDLGEWELVIQRLCLRPHCRGKNDSGWVASFEYLIRVKTFDDHMTGRFSRSRSGLAEARVGEHEPARPASGNGDGAAERNAFRAGLQAVLDTTTRAGNDVPPEVGEVLTEWLEDSAKASSEQLWEMEGEFLAKLFSVLPERRRNEITEQAIAGTAGTTGPARERMLRALTDKAVRELLELPRP